jgi:hypothetical protein
MTGSQDKGDVFTKSLYGLRPGTTYYYRACGETSDNVDHCGVVKSFTTDAEEPADDDNDDEVKELDIDTLSARSIEKRSAILRARVENKDDVKV